MCLENKGITFGLSEGRLKLIEQIKAIHIHRQYFYIKHLALTCKPTDAISSPSSVGSFFKFILLCSGIHLQRYYQFLFLPVVKGVHTAPTSNFRFFLFYVYSWIYLQSLKVQRTPFPLIFCCSSTFSPSAWISRLSCLSLRKYLFNVTCIYL